MCRYLVRGSRGVSDHSTAVLTWKVGINLKKKVNASIPLTSGSAIIRQVD
jgi:hypothetical protein